MRKTLLFISGGTEAVPGIKLAKSMGLRVLVTDGNNKAPGFKYADDFAIISTYDIPKTVSFAIEYNRKIKKIDGVMTLASDVPLTVSSVANALKLPGNTIQSAKLASDKLLMKKKFFRDSIPIPIFAEIEDKDGIERFIGKHGYPVVIKPVDSRGARGVLRLTNGVDLSEALRISQTQSPSNTVIIEKFLDGPQISTESIIYNGSIYTPGLSNRNYEYLETFSPYIIENGGDLPALLTKKQKSEIDEVLFNAAKSLGIERGSLKGDIVCTEEGPKIIEIAARLSGGWFCTDQIPLSTGVDIVAATISLALGGEIAAQDLIPKYNRGVATRYFFAKPGYVKAIRNFSAVEKLPWVHKLGFCVEPGEVIEPVTDHTKRAGFVITTGQTRNEAVERARHVVNTVQIETMPTLN